ncbi:HTH domain-containing protein [Sulfitobacter dubius]|uniref:HTH domain-containing protein n=1 Tax=Sulfitobacter dubius TaxID=218673 RepID=UPI0022AF0644|nr:HTH domain-containing protein [Sulfitobacter dubius]MCZ4367453.1 HTH domain-containing protein [Sulfitobacter dubius]
MNEFTLTGKPTYLWAAEQVLLQQKRPMRVHDIVAQAQDAGLFSDEMHSRTPQKSMQARLSMEILNNGQTSTFVRTGRGVFFLRKLLTQQDSQNSMVGSLALQPTEKLKLYKAKPRRKPNTTEDVLVIPSDACERILNFQGLKEESGKLLDELLKSGVKHIPRTTAEETEAFKQVITYVLVTYRGKVLCFRRGRFNRAAQFLRGSLCIGFGGHVTQQDFSLFSKDDYGIRENAARELAEEIKIDSSIRADLKDRISFVGVINDNSTSLGRKHLAVVFQYEVQENEWDKWQSVSKHEMSINELRWIDTETETINLVDFEYWSQLSWRTLSPQTIEAQPEYRIFRKKPFQKPHMLALVGGIGSGKSSATKIFVEQFGYAEVNSGRVLADLLSIPPVPHTPRDVFQGQAWDFITRDDGPDRLARALIQAAAATESPYVIIDGVRQQSTLASLRKLADGALALIFVYATPDLALKLYCQREGLEETTYEKEFFQAIGASVESDINHMMNSADAVIYNWSGEADYLNVLSSMVEELGIVRNE